MFNPMVGIIIPNYNREQIIPLCIDAIRNSTYSHYEIIVVDDCSTDNSVNVIEEKAVRLIRLRQKSGPAVARNTGAKEGSGDILLFIDSDVLVKEDTIAVVVRTFNEHPSISAVVGMPDKNCPFENISSQHFNLRVHFNYLNLPDYISHTYTSLMGIRKEAFFEVGGFNEKLRSAGIEDDELGFDLIATGHKIFASKKLSITHYKYMSFWRLLRNDVARTIDRVKLMFRQRKLSSSIAEKRYISTPTGQILSAVSIPFLYVVGACIFISSWFSVLLILYLILFLNLNLPYISFIRRGKGLFYAFKIYLLLLIDMSFVNIGLCIGFLKFVRGERY